MRALAATGATEQAPPFYAEPEFWVLIAFVILIAGAGRPVFRIIAAALDDRSERIKGQIEEATRLREEAQELLASYERRQADAEGEAEAMLARAREEAQRMGERAAEDLERAVARRRQQAIDRIDQAEAKALAEVRLAAVDVALEAARRLLAEKVSGAKADELIDDAIKELPEKLH